MAEPAKTYTPQERAANEAKAKAAGKTNATILDRAANDKNAEAAINKAAEVKKMDMLKKGIDTDEEPDYTGMGMVEHGAARKKWMMAQEEKAKKKAERDALRKMP